MPAIYDGLMTFLADKDCDSAGMLLSEVPEKFRDSKTIASAWAAGLIEFGRRHYSMCGTQNDDKNDNRRHREEARLDGDGYSWSGGKRNSHKPFRDLLKEEDALPSKVYEMEKIEDKSTNPPTIRIKRTEHTGAILKLRVRLTDKGYASLGVAV